MLNTTMLGGEKQQLQGHTKSGLQHPPMRAVGRMQVNFATQEQHNVNRAREGRETGRSLPWHAKTELQGITFAAAHAVLHQPHTSPAFFAAHPPCPWCSPTVTPHEYLSAASQPGVP